MNIANRIGAYVDAIYKISADKRLRHPKVVPTILRQLKGACEITGLSERALLEGLDFKPKDKTVSALEAFLAELRTVHLLHELGFDHIQPIEALIAKAPDFEALFCGKKCLIEVFCLPAEFAQAPDKNGLYINFNPESSRSKFGRHFLGKARKKKKQLDAETSVVKILLGVVNYLPVCALNTREDVMSHAKYFFEELKWGEGYHIGLLYGDIGCIYPNLLSSNLL